LAAQIFAALLPVLLALPLTIPIAIIDLRARIIPNGLNLALLLVGLGFAAAREPDAAPEAVGLALIEVAAAYLLFWAFRAAYGRLRGRTGLGLGDVKFIAAAMPWIGLAQLPLMVLIASIGALATVGLLRLSGHRVGSETRLPFGPFLALGLHGAQLLRPDL
jgi:leader peptidase (prepilin peptidase) / N-methyltransferase